jgi:hypothetical protein
MAGPSLLQSEVERRFAITTARDLIDESENCLARGDLQGAILRIGRAARKLAEVIEALDKVTT